MRALFQHILLSVYADVSGLCQILTSMSLHCKADRLNDGVVNIYVDVNVNVNIDVKC